MDAQGLRGRQLEAHELLALRFAAWNNGVSHSMLVLTCIQASYETMTTSRCTLMSGSGAFWGDSRPLRETCGWCLPGVLLCGAATYLRLSWLLREDLALTFHVATTLNSFHFNPKP